MEKNWLVEREGKDFPPVNFEHVITFVKENDDDASEYKIKFYFAGSARTVGWRFDNDKERNKYYDAIEDMLRKERSIDLALSDIKL